MYESETLTNAPTKYEIYAQSPTMYEALAPPELEKTQEYETLAIAPSKFERLPRNESETFAPARHELIAQPHTMHEAPAYSPTECENQITTIAPPKDERMLMNEIFEMKESETYANAPDTSETEEDEYQFTTTAPPDYEMRNPDATEDDEMEKPKKKLMTALDTEVFSAEMMAALSLPFFPRVPRCEEEAHENSVIDYNIIT